MPAVNVLEHSQVGLRDSGITEDYVRRYIASNPAKFGSDDDLTLLTRELRQAKAGRLDILLANRDTEPEQRYEVEVQLGKTDEGHIVRCIEYWDLARRTWPRFAHIAIPVADDITSRFFNVIQLGNRAIPIIALRMVASKVNGGSLLQSVTVLRESSQSPEEEEECATPAANRV